VRACVPTIELYKFVISDILLKRASAFSFSLFNSCFDDSSVSFCNAFFKFSISSLICFSISAASFFKVSA
jgi:hypothetical protein